jgi:hypothetical protein
MSPPAHHITSVTHVLHPRRVPRANGLAEGRGELKHGAIRWLEMRDGRFCQHLTCDASANDFDEHCPSYHISFLSLLTRKPTSGPVRTQWSLGSASWWRTTMHAFVPAGHGWTRVLAAGPSGDESHNRVVRPPPTQHERTPGLTSSADPAPRELELEVATAATTGNRGCKKRGTYLAIALPADD